MSGSASSRLLHDADPPPWRAAGEAVYESLAEGHNGCWPFTARSRLPDRYEADRPPRKVAPRSSRRHSGERPHDVERSAAEGWALLSRGGTVREPPPALVLEAPDRQSTRLNSSH